MTLLRILITATFLICFNLNAQDDSYRWLEEVTSEKSLEFVTNQNKITEAKLSVHKEYHDSKLINGLVILFLIYRNAMLAKS